MSYFTERVSVKAMLFIFISSVVADSFIRCHRHTDTRCPGIRNGKKKKKTFFVEIEHSEEFLWLCRTNPEMSGR